jgi:NADH:ubiquinone oxidoreductase subunit 5 (subunit L)/multisubunit Na+/H+ antiporter MnhA subunit
MSNEVLIIIAIFLPFLSVFVLAPLGVKLKGKIGWVALVFPIISTAAIITLATRLGWGTSQVIEISWVPLLGINLSFLFDGLSTFYGLIVSGMGILITFYARFYLGEKYAFQNRFYAYLMMFMAAMLGTVFSNNLMLLFISWEMTGLMSFFLIGFLHHNEKSRIGARMALIVTGMTGLMIMVGVVIIGINTGTYSLAELLSNPEVLGANKPWMNVALLFLMIGAFGKSAQFPFFFWLPNAMAAPTPVSAYLHCATMVKLGIFLSARIYPIFVGTDLWGPLLITAGFLTMVVGSVLAYSSHDLKSILAYSTVAQLGFLIGFYGMGTPAGVQHDYFHVLNHVFYKGSLFMIAGIIDHAAGTRDIRKLGGLFRYMPLTAIAFIIMNLSMAGIPGTMGFVSKELVINQLLAYQGIGGFALMFGFLTYAFFMAAFSIRLFMNTFFGKMSDEVREHLHKPGFFFQLPAILPVILVITFGFFPNILGHALEHLSVMGLQAKFMSHLALWHGFNGALKISGLIVFHGILFYYLAQRKQWAHVRIPTWLKFDDAFNFLYDKMVYHAKTVTTALLGNSSFNFLPVIIVSSLTLLSGYFIYLLTSGYDFYFGQIVMPDLLSIFVFLIIVLGIIGTVFYTTWLKKLIALSVTGFMITFYFVLYRAPDLALTQLLIETVSLILILLLLTRLPKEDNVKNKNLKLSKTNQFFAIMSSLTVGIIVFVSILMVTGNPHAEPMGAYFIKNTLPLAQGSNAVNTILVDFRGFDTMGEITVLVIAMLGVLGLVMRKRLSR